MPKREREEESDELRTLNPDEVDTLMKSDLIQVPEQIDMDPFVNKRINQPVDPDDSGVIDYLREQGEWKDKVPITIADRYSRSGTGYYVLDPEKVAKKLKREEVPSNVSDFDSIHVKGVEDTTSSEPFGGKKRKSHKKSHKKGRKSHKKSHKKNHKRRTLKRHHKKSMRR